MASRQLAEYALRFLVRAILGPLASIMPRSNTKIFERLFFYLNEYPTTTNYLTILSRPRTPSGKGFRPVALGNNGESTAIVMQGPITLSDHFTLQTLKLYRNMFPSSRIIFSTWSGEDPEALRKIKNAGAELVLCDKPGISGFLNFNFQRQTTIQGLKAAKRLGAHLVLKTRSDQRLYSRHSISFLLALVRNFPARNSLKCKHRIFFLDLSSLSNVPFHLSDMLQFGDIDDLIHLWSAPEHEQSIGRSDYAQVCEGKLKISEIIHRRPTNPEVWLGKHYAEWLYGGQCVEDPLNTYRRLLTEAVGIVDRFQLDLYWPKYHAYTVHHDYDIPKIAEVLTFSKWISINNGICTETEDINLGDIL